MLIDNNKLMSKKRNNNLSYNSSLVGRHTSLSGKNSDPTGGDFSSNVLTEKKLRGSAENKKVFKF